MLTDYLLKHGHIQYRYVGTIWGITHFSAVGRTFAQMILQSSSHDGDMIPNPKDKILYGEPLFGSTEPCPIYGYYIEDNDLWFYGVLGKEKVLHKLYK